MRCFFRGWISRSGKTPPMNYNYLRLLIFINSNKSIPCMLRYTNRRSRASLYLVNRHCIRPTNTKRIGNLMKNKQFLKACFRFVYSSCWKINSYWKLVTSLCLCTLWNYTKVGVDIVIAFRRVVVRYIVCLWLTACLARMWFFRWTMAGRYKNPAGLHAFYLEAQ